MTSSRPRPNRGQSRETLGSTWAHGLTSLHFYIYRSNLTRRRMFASSPCSANLTPIQRGAQSNEGHVADGQAKTRQQRAHGRPVSGSRRCRRASTDAQWQYQQCRGPLFTDRGSGSVRCLAAEARAASVLPGAQSKDPGAKGLAAFEGHGIAETRGTRSKVQWFETVDTDGYCRRCSSKSSSCARSCSTLTTRPRTSGASLSC